MNVFYEINDACGAPKAHLMAYIYIFICVDVKCVFVKCAYLECITPGQQEIEGQTGLIILKSHSEFEGGIRDKPDTYFVRIIF